jgi:hypothetical protein
MLLAAAAMVLSVVDGRSGCSVVRSLGVGFIHLLSCVSSLASLALGRCVFPPKSRFAKRDSLVLQNETRFSEESPGTRVDFLPKQDDDNVKRTQVRCFGHNMGKASDQPPA